MEKRRCKLERDRTGRSDLHYAALENNIEKVHLLLESGADPNEADHEGFTPLHFAAQQHSVASAQLLLEQGATVDPINCYGNTPLWAAVFNSKGRGELIQLLRSHGANVSHANAAGVTPVGLARTIGNYNIAQYFEDLSSDKVESD